MSRSAAAVRYVIVRNSHYTTRDTSQRNSLFYILESEGRGFSLHKKYQ